MFRTIYEVFGLNPFFSSNMASFLGGIEDLCSEPYSGVSLYMFFGIVMLVSSGLIYALKYHIMFDLSRFSYIKYWWIFAGATFSFNFGFASINLWTRLKNAVLNFDCDEEFINVIFNIPDVAVFAFVNGVLGFLVFTLLSWPPVLRKFSKHCFRLTPFKC